VTCDGSRGMTGRGGFPRVRFEGHDRPRKVLIAYGSKGMTPRGVPEGAGRTSARWMSQAPPQAGQRASLRCARGRDRAACRLATDVTHAWARAGTVPPRRGMAAYRCGRWCRTLRSWTWAAGKLTRAGASSRKANALAIAAARRSARMKEVVRLANMCSTLGVSAVGTAVRARAFGCAKPNRAVPAASHRAADGF